MKRIHLVLPSVLNMTLAYFFSCWQCKHCHVRRLQILRLMYLKWQEINATEKVSKTSWKEKRFTNKASRWHYWSVLFDLAGEKKLARKTNFIFWMQLEKHPFCQTCENKDFQSNRPFAAFHSRGTKPPCWDAKIALGQDKQRKLPF